MGLENEFLDFIGKEVHLLSKLEKIEQQDVDLFAGQFNDFINQYERIKDNTDIELIALKAYQQGKITRVQIATFLEGLYLFRTYRTTLIPIIDHEGKINDVFKPLFIESIKNLLQYNNKNPLTLSESDLDEIVRQFALRLSLLPVSEHYAYQFKDENLENFAVRNFYMQTGTLIGGDTHLSVGARDVLMQVLYGKNAKSLWPS